MDGLIERLRRAKLRHEAGYMKDVGFLLAEASDTLEAMSESVWQPIETAPKDGTDVLLLFPCGSVIEGWWNSGPYVEEWSVISLDSHGCGCCGDDNEDPTHWMPKPASPKEARNG